MGLTPVLLGDILIIAVVALILFHTASLYSSKRLVFLDPLFAFWGGVLIVYVIQPVSYSDILIEWHGQEVFVTTLLWVFVGLLFVVVGYESRVGVKLAERIPSCPATLSPSKFCFAGVLFVFLGLAGYAYLFASAGGMTEWLSVGRGGTDYENISGYIAQLADLFPLGVMVLLFHVNLHNVSPVKKISVWILAALMLWWFIYLGSRSRTIGFSIVMLASYYIPRRKNPPWSLLLGISAVLFMVCSFQATYRGYFTNLSFNLDQIDMNEAREKVLPIFLGGDRGSKSVETSAGMEFNCVMSVVELVPKQVPYNLGYGHLEVFTRAIPRAIWPDKIYPHMESVQGVLQASGLSSAYVRDTDLLMGPAFTFVGHWYYVAGPLGLILGGIITGSFLRLTRSIYDRSRDNEGERVMYVLLVGLGFGEAASTPLLWIISLPLLIGPLLIALHLCQVRPETSHRRKLCAVSVRTSA